MDIVIPYKHSSTDGLELRYTLRGLVKYFPDLGNIFVIGDCPSHLQNIIHIPVAESPEHVWKQRNIYGKLMVACQDQRVSDPFCWVSDDQFLLQPWVHGYYNRGRIMDSLKSLTPHQIYRNTLMNSMSYVGLGLDYGHCPIVFDKRRFIVTVGCLDWKMPWGYAIKSIYCELSGISGEKMVDIKIMGELTEQHIAQVLEGKSYFTCDDKAMTPAMISVLNSIYPEKSIYEI